MSEHDEAMAALNAEEVRRGKSQEASIDNAYSISEVNRSLVRFHEARAQLRSNFSGLAILGGILAVAWSVWAMVHWW